MIFVSWCLCAKELHPVVFPHRMEYIDHKTIGNALGGMRNLRRDNGGHASLQYSCFLINGQFKFTAYDIHNLFMHMVMKGDGMSGLNVPVCHRHALGMDKTPSKTRDDFF